MEEYIVAAVSDSSESNYQERIRLEKIRDKSNPFHIAEEKFRKIFRLPKSGALHLINTLNAPQVSDGHIPKHAKILCALQFFAQGSYQAAVGQDNFLGLSQPTVSRCIDSTVDAIVHQLTPREINFPTTQVEKELAKTEFQNIFNMPNTLGAVDGTHIAIAKPSLIHPTAPGNLFYNRKGFYSIHCQIDERGRLMRRTIVRYVCLCLTMVLTMISPRVKKRFPELNNLVEAGLLLDNEKTILENMNEKFPKPSKHWLPIVWATSIVTRARKEGRIRDDFAVKTIVDELNKFRGQAGLLLSYDTISVPLVYTQVVTIAVYSYFITSALGSQWVENKLHASSSDAYISNIDLYFPIFSTLEFFFYMGWLKVAESLINPFGEDDDDFEVNWLIDRDLQVSYMIVDEMHHEHPELIKDQYWDEVFPAELPYTIATENQREEHPEHSTAKIAVPTRQKSMVLTAPSQIKIDEMVPSNTVSYKFDAPEQLQMNDDAVSGIHFVVSRGSKRGKRDDRNSMGSSNSMVSLAQTQTPMTRTNSVTSMLKRLFSKEDQRTGTAHNTQTDGTSRFTISASNPALNKPAAAAATAAGSMKIANEVIEEVDEQATITSMAKRPDNRPTAMSLFPPPTPPAHAPAPAPRPRPSAPVHINNTSSDHSHHSSNTRLSSSAPNPWGHAAKCAGDKSPAAESVGAFSVPDSVQDSVPDSVQDEPRDRLDSDVGPSLSAAGSQTLLDEVDGDVDYFERLRSQRERERRDRHRQKLAARSVSAQQRTGSTELIDNDLLLEDLLLHAGALKKEDGTKDDTT